MKLVALVVAGLDLVVSSSLVCTSVDCEALLDGRGERD